MIGQLAMTRTVLFVDADNQPPTLAAALGRFLATIGRSCTRAIVSGNGVGDRVHGWQHAIEDAFPGIEVHCHVAPVRKQSADARLLFELAPYYHADPDPSLLLVVLSRDDLLVAAAEGLAGRGHNTLLVLCSGSVGSGICAEVPVVVLSSPQPCSLMPTAPAASLPKAASASTSDTRIVLDALTKIRETLRPHAQGGYAASAVGHVLAQLGHDKAARAKIVKAIPNLKQAGVGPEKRLIF